ncbi:hypothetical protein QBC45DRAFT_470075 [Copromyces sp. CBS 386.78]|nr:hypothetical protein QBC45DRAFT_470075 [Copromyces sp. CBS 386.78]
MDYTNPVHLSHPQSEKDFLAQYYARLSLADPGADKKSPIPATAPSTVTVTPEAPAQQSQIVTETTGTGELGRNDTRDRTGAVVQNRSRVFVLGTEDSDGLIQSSYPGTKRDKVSGL